MKKLILILLILLPVYLRAQQVKKPGPKPKAAVNTQAQKVVKPKPKAKTDETLWIMDSVRVTQADVDAAVKRTDLAEVLMLTKDEAQRLYQVDNVGMIITKVRARREYKENFSAVSPAYKKYITDNYGVDNAIDYYVDGVLVNEVRPLNTIWQASKKVMLLTFKPDGLGEGEKGKPVALIITNKGN